MLWPISFTIIDKRPSLSMLYTRALHSLEGIIEKSSIFLGFFILIKKFCYLSQVRSHWIYLFLFKFRLFNNNAKYPQAFRVVPLSNVGLNVGKTQIRKRLSEIWILFFFLISTDSEIWMNKIQSFSPIQKAPPLKSPIFSSTLNFKQTNKKHFQVNNSSANFAIKKSLLTHINLVNHS